MDATEFRETGHRLVDWIADYLENAGNRPVRGPVRPGALLERLPASAPERGGGASEWDAIVRDLDELIVPGLTHWQSPGFFAYFPCNNSGPAILGELVSAGLGIQGMLWSTSPASTELEIRMLQWLGRLVGLPAGFLDAPGGGCLQGTASEATLVALVAARKRRAAPSHRLVAYASTQAHSSVLKAVRIAGLDDAQLRLVDADATHAMDPSALARAVAEDDAQGRVPFFVCATVGTTSSGAVDPLPAVREAAPGCWMHVDAAWAGSACVCEEHRWMLDGIDGADSLVLNPHKWLLTNFDCSAFWTRDRASLVDALSVTPEYLRNRASESGEVVDHRDWGIPLGRRFRALKLWFVMRRYGAEGLRAHIRSGIELARRFEEWVDADARFELAAPRSLALVCFRLRGSDAANAALLERVNGSGEAFLTHTTLPDGAGGSRFVIRMAIGGTRTREEHVRRAWDVITREVGAS
jgi:aromatic-L-amino-acid decarboxylase